MFKSKIKKMLCVTIAAMSLMCTGVTTFASTIPFDVTVGGTGTQDPLSKKELKSTDGDQYAYFTGKTFSTSTSYINVRSYRKGDSTLHTTIARLQHTGAGSTFKRPYCKTAPGNVYYFMRARTKGSRIRVTGNYCP